MRLLFFLLFSLVFLAAGLITGAFLLLAILTLGGVFLAMFIRQKITGQPFRVYTFEQSSSSHDADAPNVIEGEYKEIEK